MNNRKFIMDIRSDDPAFMAWNIMAIQLYEPYRVSPDDEWPPRYDPVAFLGPPPEPPVEKKKPRRMRRGVKQPPVEEKKPVRRMRRGCDKK